MVLFSENELYSFSKNKGKKLMYENKKTLDPDINEDEFFYKLAHPIRTFKRSKGPELLKEFFTGVKKPKEKIRKPLTGYRKKLWVRRYKKRYVKPEPKLNLESWDTSFDNYLFEEESKKFRGPWYTHPENKVYKMPNHERINRNYLSMKLSNRRSIGNIEQKRKREILNQRGRKTRLERFFERD